MAISAETLQKLEEAKVAMQEYADKRNAEIDDLVANLKAYGVPLDSVTAPVSETAASDALATIQTLLG